MRGAAELSSPGEKNQMFYFPTSLLPPIEGRGPGGEGGSWGSADNGCSPIVPLSPLWSQRPTLFIFGVFVYVRKDPRPRAGQLQARSNHPF